VTPAARGLTPPGADGTGLGGRAALRDIGAVLAARQEAAAQAAQDIPDMWEEPLPNIRKRIAKAMQESLSTMAQLTHTATYDATELLALRRRFKESGKPYGMDGVTLGDLILFAVVRTLTQPEHAPLNAHLLGDTVRYFRHVQLGVAVDTPRGLMVPTLRDADKKTLAEISRETKALASACQTGAIDPDLLAGGSFTVSNLGAFEVEHFTPVINPPQTGILGVNAIQQRVREKDGQIQVYPAMSLSLTYDHRALDGAPASRFLRDLKRNLENIQMLLGGGAFHV
jgi:pyruvate dehydrogenase E2 component (dihydrolipoamide acetyltransferase)